MEQVKNFFCSPTVNNINPIFVRKFNDTRPYLYVDVLGMSILALVDSGSNSSILGSGGLSLLKQNNIPIQYDNNLCVTTADGRAQEVFGYVSIPIICESISKTLKILVIPSLTHSLILGVDFLKVFGIHLNFSSSTYDLAPTSTLCTINTIQSFSALSETQKTELQHVVNLFKTIAPPDRLGLTHMITHTIDTGDHKPVRQRQYPLSPAMQQYLNKEIDEMLNLNIIQASQSPWCSPLWLVPKKESGKYRVCFDGRKLNQITVSDAYPMPQIDSILCKLRDSRYLSSIDLRSAFNQIPLDPSSRPKTAFAVYGKGLFEYKVMPFGLLNSPKTLVRLMDQIIGPSLEPFCFVYLDDIIVSTPDFSTHLQVLKEILSRLKSANLTVNMDKCEFCRSSLSYLGFIVDCHGLRTDPSKVEAIVNYPIPKNTTEIKRLIGLVGYYRRFVKDFSALCSPISDLLHGRKKGQPISWTPEADQAFQAIKSRLTSAPILAAPDFSQTFYLACDSSDTGVGSVLYQQCDGIEHPIAYASKTLNKCQRKYSTTEKELYAVIVGIETFRKYIEGTHFVVETDHASLVWLHNLSNPSGRLARWAVRLSQYDFKIVHRKGSQNIVADALSRSLSENAVLDITTVKRDKWYQKMITRVQENPESYPSFRVENNILYKHIFHHDPLITNLSNWKIVVPTANRAEIFQLYHNSETAGHFGVSKTLSRILELYYWSGIRKDVYRYVRQCAVCAASKIPNLPRAGLMGDYQPINFPFQRISCDLLGPYPRSTQGNQYLFVVVDWFTKYVLVHPMSKATSKGIIKFLENQVFLIYGVPQIVSCDNGSQFISKEFKTLMTTYKVQKIWYNAKFHPQINHSERTNKVIVTSLRAYIHGNHKTWDSCIYKVTQAIRLAKHDVTGYSPAFLTFGRNIPLTGDYYGKISENSQNVESITNKNQLIEDLQVLPKLYIDIREKLYNAYRRNANQYNLRKRSLTFHVGDRVWKKNYTLSSKPNDYSAKLAAKYIPCIVTKVVSKLVYSLQDTTGKDLGNWHVKDIKPDFCNLKSDGDSEISSSSDEA